MISNVSSTVVNTSVPQILAVKSVPSSSSQGATSNEDTVQLSADTQKLLATTKIGGSGSEPNITDIVKEAADGDIAALAKLALIG